MNAKINWREKLITEFSLRSPKPFLPNNLFRKQLDKNGNPFTKLPVFSITSDDVLKNLAKCNVIHRAKNSQGLIFYLDGEHFFLCHQNWELVRGNGNISTDQMIFINQKLLTFAKNNVPEIHCTIVMPSAHISTAVD